MSPDLSREQFIERFRARMMERVGSDDEDLQRYANYVAGVAWEEPNQRDEGPEACADTDISYWEAG